MIEFLKEYQVAEHKDGKWSVCRISDQIAMGSQMSGSITLRAHGFNTAAEAQELADELNGDSNDS